MPNRRRFLQGISSLPLLATPSVAAPVKRDYFKELGIKPFINAAGTYTTLTASLMQPEVVQAIDYASKQFVHLIEVHDAVGQRIATLIGCEAAMVTAGAASALTLGTAACMTGTNQDFIRRLPDTTGMKRAVNDRTAMMLFLNENDPKGAIKGAEFVQLGKKHNVPTFIDAAADVPPVDHLSRYTKMGFDLVTFSGGKGLRGPQSCGLLLGRKDLIAAARLNGPPNSDTIGRGMKVNKEEYLGMMVAIEQYVNRDHAAEWKEWEKRVKVVADSVGPIHGIKTETFIPEIANAVPHLRITWDPGTVKITAKEAVKRLREGDPAIELRPGSKDGLEVAVWMLQPGEAQIVAKRIREVLRTS